MKERPIYMTTDEVNAILDGRKTQVRRIAKPEVENRWSLVDTLDGASVFNESNAYGIPGDRLWVRETWCYVGEVPGPEIIYKATTPDFMGWCSPAIMPRWASRITLEILSTRVERLKQITDSDCYAEGIESDISDVMGEPRIKFARLWDTLNAKRGYPWADNPFVWVIEFRLLA